MKSLDRIPTSKIERAGKLVQTGVKLGGNYVRHYGKKLLNPDLERDHLDAENARDVYDGLKDLKLMHWTLVYLAGALVNVEG